MRSTKSSLNAQKVFEVERIQRICSKYFSAYGWRARKKIVVNFSVILLPILSVLVAFEQSKKTHFFVSKRKQFAPNFASKRK